MEVLMGKPDGFPGYLKNGVVGHDDIYVIAVNGRLLRGFGGTFGELNGISQFPFAVEATFAIGPLHIRIDRNTLVSGQPKHQERYLMEKPIGQPVPADTFLTAEYSNISAIWATDICELSLRGSAPASAVVHNPRARNPLPLGFLPAQNEYVARQIDDNSYQLDRTDGTLADKGS
jgi:type I restriction enzyme S subunit